MTKAPGIRIAAESVSLSTSNWFIQLAEELSIEPSKLRSEMLDFRASFRVPQELRSIYPTERAIETMGRGLPQRHTIDFVLSFLDMLHRTRDEYQFDEGALTFTKFGIALLEEAKKPHVMALTRALDSDQFRREKFWEDRQEYVERILCGTYVMYRNSRTGIGEGPSRRTYTEILHIKKARKYKQLLSCYWRRNSGGQWITYFGDFIICERYLYGTFVNRSTDNIIRPVNMNILSRYASEAHLESFVLTGSITGTSYEQDKILHYPFALRRVKKKHIKEQYFGVEKITPWNFEEFADDLLSDPNFKLGSKLYTEFIRQNHVEYDGMEMNRRS